MAGSNDFNASIIAEFHDNDGKVSGPFEGMPMVLVHHKGARSGKARVTPLVAQVDGEQLYIFASKGGAPTHPSWYHNLDANPDATIDFGTQRDIGVRVRELEGDERSRVWDAQKAAAPQFAEYEAKTTRTIPVLALDRV
jgi:deazaflavin-dependent oxidoreductase (nitroreductase family)